MSIKSFASKQFSTHLLDERRRDKARARAERERRRKGEPHRIEFFHQVDDPYSHLLAQALVKLQERYDVDVVTWLVEPPEDWAAPARALLESYSLVDARRLAEKAGFHVTSAEPPDAELVLSVQRQLTATLEAPEEPGSAATLEAAVALGMGLWSGEPVAAGEGTATDATLQAAVRAGTERRADLGHYLGGTCFYGGEWTWGIDRLAYLEERLADLGAEIPPAADAGQRAGAPTEDAPTGGAPIYAQPRLLEEPVPADALEATDLPDLHFFASFRSPYTWISTARVIRLAEAFGVNLRIRFVLPMVMRGLPVKKSKRVYILLDAAREARRNGVQFGPISDPVGKPVERGYSLLPWAIEQGRGIEYFRSFMTLAFSQAVDAGSDRGLRRIVEEAGLDWTEGRGYLGDPTWREEAERNREELFDLGLWGVPSFRVGSVATWGQDRLWVLEDEYRRLTSGS
ncbi:MAG: 2-hydroxychromene-2-carboxylate isomerase [Holophagales bacterium]|nr:2-hydroxychromene-2-carboxylate isomerase [Holophagales bacterium]MYD23871.1 2-hydroxychromene-2-carboxylate isomerase [Holophagales bacterium]MYI34520.1 2-hydroxychromene-2-carboxylate isomerase [Holophagales bacterium]